MEKADKTSKSQENKPAPAKNQTVMDKLLRSDIIVYVIFLLILVLCIFFIGRVIGLGSPTY